VEPIDANIIYSELLTFRLYMTIYCDMKAFLGNELTDPLPRRDLFLETNWLRNMFSVNTKTEAVNSWKPDVARKLTHISAVMDKHRIIVELLGVVT
jgi:hypothetical protein